MSKEPQAKLGPLNSPREEEEEEAAAEELGQWVVGCERERDGAQERQDDGGREALRARSGPHRGRRGQRSG